jgi:RNAse (barnase) inhibitor barstar
MEEEIRVLREDLKLVKSDPHLYHKVFDGIIRVLEDNTSFLKLGHSVEQARVLDIAYESVQQIRKVRDATTEDELVDSAQVATNSVVNLLRATKRLVSVQEKSNEMLSGRVEAAQNIMMATLPSFLERCKEKIDLPTDLNLERQQDSCQQLTSILEEVISIIKEVKGDYDSSFADQVINDAGSDAQKKLRSAVKNVTGMLAKLHAAAEDAEKSKLQEDVVNLTKQVAEELGNQGEDDSKFEFVQAVKQGISPAHKDFFQSQKRLTTIAVKATKPTLAVNQEGSKDMLEAAKDMLSALKGISTSLSDAPELKGVL